MSIEGRIDLTLNVNGEPRSASVEPRTLLSDFLRHGLGLTGTHVGCEHGVCGACTVLVDGQPVRSCLMFAIQVGGAPVITVEGLSKDGDLHPIQDAFRREHGLQCGFCTPGLLMTAIDLPRRMPQPTERQVREAISGNLCRCTGYEGVVRAVLRAIALHRANTESSQTQSITQGERHEITQGNQVR